MIFRRTFGSGLISVCVVAVLSSLSHLALFAQTVPTAAGLLQQMTLEEKVAQLSQLPGFPIPEFKEQVGVEPEEIARKYGAASCCG